MPFDFACPDWFERLQAGKPPIADLPLDRNAAERAVAVFDNLRLPDVAGNPTLGDSAGEWFREIVRAAFGSTDTNTNIRQIAEIFCLIPKKNSKTTYTAALGLTALLLNEEPRAEMQIVGPTQEAAQKCYDQMVGMINADPVDDETGRAYLSDRFHVQDHKRQIVCRITGATMKVKTFDMRVVTGSIPSLTIVDELHLLGRVAMASRVIAQIRGGMIARPNALLVFITTQSDEAPSGVFKAELTYARAVRDGKIREDVKTLPILYEFPLELQGDETQPWLDPALWPLVNPNLGRPVTLDALRRLMREAREKGKAEFITWASQHLNIEVNARQSAEKWVGSLYWVSATVPEAGLDSLLTGCEVITGGVDGGGLDDLAAAGLCGRRKSDQAWLIWARGWAMPEVLERRKDIVAQLEDFIAQGDLILCERPTQDFEEITALFAQVQEAGLFPEDYGIGLDPYGVAALVDSLATAGLEAPLVTAIPQGVRLSPTIWGVERKLRDGTLLHCGQPLLTWAMGNARAEQKGSAVAITKEISGRAKIDPLMAALNACALMARNPVAVPPAHSPWDDPNFSLRSRSAA